MVGLETHLVFELLAQRPVEPLDDAAALRHVGLGMDQVDPQGGTARTEAEAAIGRAVIEKEFLRADHGGPGGGGSRTAGQRSPP